VTKIVTAASVIEYGLSNPTRGAAGSPARSTWAASMCTTRGRHGVAPYTTTGIFGKSSNVGTLMLAAADRPGNATPRCLAKFGLGQRTGVGLPGESAGLVPPIDQWSGSNLRQPAYRPRSFDDTATDDKHVPDNRQRRCARPAPHHQDHRRRRRHAHRRAEAGGRAGGFAANRADGRQMLRATVQRDPRGGAGRAPASQAAVDGYQISGKTGTAQQINRAAAATTTTSTGSRSRAWRPPTIPATSSASWPTTRSALPTDSTARRWHR